MISRTLFRGSLVVASLLLAACATQPAVDQANNTVKLMSLVDTQVRQFQQVEQAAEQALSDSLHAQQKFSAQLQVPAALDANAAKSAGDTLRGPMQARMLADADGVASANAAFEAAKAAQDQKFGRLLAPLPSPSGAIIDTQTKVAVIGVELSLQTRVDELTTIAKEIKKNVDDNKKKIKDAQTAAAAEQTTAAAKQAAALAAVDTDNATLIKK